MKTEDLQKKLGYSRSTLYRYMRGINQITPDIEPKIAAALNLNKAEAFEFSKYISLSSFDQSLIDSRNVLDEFLFGNAATQKEFYDIDMIFYDNDRYLRTLNEIFTIIFAYRAKSELKGNIKIVNCLNNNIFVQIKTFLHNIFSVRLNIETEHFVSFSETDYRQNALSFIEIFPLIKYEKYKLYHKEKDMEDTLVNDSILISLRYTENGNLYDQYFALSFAENSMPECIAFTDNYMYSFMAKTYINLKNNFDSIIHTYTNVAFNDDIFTELAKKETCYLIKPNPCYDKIPCEVFEKMIRRVSNGELIKFLSSLYGKELDSEITPIVLEKALQYQKKRLNCTYVGKQIDVYSKVGLLEFHQTGKLTDHLEYLPAFDKEETAMILSYINDRDRNLKDDYKLYITEKELTQKDLVIIAAKNFGIAIEYICPTYEEGLWKMFVIQSKRLAEIFCDYIENHIPINYALKKDNADEFMKSLL